MSRTRISTAVFALTLAAIVAQPAFAGGEPKNQLPFTRVVATRSAQAALHSTPVLQQPIRGEPKNEVPFTRPATVVVASSAGFDWTSGGLGAAAGVGIALAGVGVSLLRAGRRSPQTV